MRGRIGKDYTRRRGDHMERVCLGDRLRRPLAHIGASRPLPFPRGGVSRGYSDSFRVGLGMYSIASAVPRPWKAGQSPPIADYSMTCCARGMSATRHVGPVLDGLSCCRVTRTKLAGSRALSQSVDTCL